MKYSHQLKAQSYHINRFGELALPNLFWYIQEIAWEHAQKLGFGFDHLREEQLYWVLSRLLMRIERLPKWTEEFTLETWSRGTDGLFAYRDLRFLDATGTVIVAATTSWLVLDLGSKRIQRLSQFKNFPAYQESAMGGNPGKVDSAETDTVPEYIPVQFSELDINQHFNSGRYLERIVNSYPLDFHQNFRLQELEVNFIKEGLAEDRLAVQRQAITPEEHLCSVLRASDNADLIRSRWLWRKKEA